MHVIGHKINPGTCKVQHLHAGVYTGTYPGKIPTVQRIIKLMPTDSVRLTHRSLVLRKMGSTNSKEESRVVGGVVGGGASLGDWVDGSRRSCWDRCWWDTSRNWNIVSGQYRAAVCFGQGIQLRKVGYKRWRGSPGRNGGRPVLCCWWLGCFGSHQHRSKGGLPQ